MWLQKFARPSGFSGSIPRNWIDDALSLCPFCHNDPKWEFGLKAGWINRYHFRCTNSNCRIVISISAPELMPKGMAFVSPIVLLGQTKKKSLKFESEGENVDLNSLVGSEFTLGDLQQMCKDETHFLYCNYCNARVAEDAKFCTDCGEKLDA